MPRIHLLWKGPHTYQEVCGMRDEAIDYGIYQVQGPHPASGGDTLLYIGQANGETFGKRFGQPDHRYEWNPEDPWTDNTEMLRFFTGRIHRTWRVVDNEKWETYINVAERLLIAAHAPPRNAQGVGGIKRKEAADYEGCHVLNWGNRAFLLPEVSSFRHAWAESERIKDEPLEWTGA